MSASTVIFKNPGSGCSAAKRMEKYTTNFVAMMLWGMAALINSVHPNINSKTSGISLSVTPLDVLIMLITTYFLAKGLKKSIYWLVLPWIAVSLYNMYNIQYFGACEMYKVLQKTRVTDPMPWIAFGSYVVGLGIRCILVVRVAFLALNQWYHVKLTQALRP